MKRSIIKNIVALIVLIWYLPSINAEIRYNIIDLGIGTAWSVNNDRQVVGNNPGGAVLFDITGEGNHIRLGSINGCAYSIGDNGQIVGYDSLSQWVSHAIFFDSTGNYTNNIDLTPLAAYPNYAYARDINSNGLIVGEVGSEAVLFDPTGNGNNLSLGAGAAHSINDFGQIVGHNGTQATLFDPTGQQQNNIDLGTLGGDLSYARSINNSGQIVGVARAIVGKGQQQLRATLFDPTGGGENIDLGTSGFTQSDALCINNLGQIVGILGNGECAALFDPTGNGNNIVLNTLIDPTLGWDLKEANWINDNGWIVGIGTSPDGIGHAFLLTPIPEPCTLLLFALGGLFIRKR